MEGAAVMIGLGTLANTGAILLGGVLGAFLIPRVPDHVRQTTMQVLGLGVLLIGLQMAWTTKEMLLVLVGLALGAVTGELLQIESRLERWAQRVERLPRFGREGMATAFVQTTLLFCIGAMAITGALQDGLQGDPTTLYAKAILDGVSSIMFGSVLGPGVILSALPVFLYQGGMTLGASLLTAFLSPAIIREVAAAGGLMVMAIGLNIIGLTKIRVGNLVPALLFVGILVALFGKG
jgi:uncharacterized membrane protein YqgA involved in biofilm formation